MAKSERPSVLKFLRKTPRKIVLRIELWTKRSKIESAGECSHEAAMLIMALSAHRADPREEQRSAICRCYKALTGETMPKEKS